MYTLSESDTELYSVWSGFTLFTKIPFKEYQA